MNPAYHYDILAAPVSDDFIIVGIRGNLILGAGFQYYELKSLGPSEFRSLV